MPRPSVTVTGTTLIGSLWRAVDRRALVGAERADAVAGAEEREVACDDLVEQSRELGLDALLHGGLLLERDPTR